MSAKPSGAYRVLHTADWHLGKLLGDLSREDEHARFLDFLLGVIVDEEVDALIVAGDVFDSANPPQSAQAQYYEFLANLYHARSCSVLIVAGNHDSPTQLESPRGVLKTLRATIVGRVADDPIVWLPDRESARLAVAAIPFLRDRDLRSGQMGQGAEAIKEALLTGIAKRYADAAEMIAGAAGEVPALATGHLTVIGSAVADSEREIHIGGLGSVTTSIFPEIFDYVALGHLHRPQSCGGVERVRYAGSPIPLSFSEAEDTKAVRVLDFDAGGLVGQSGIEVPAARKLIQLRTSRAGLEQGLAGLAELDGGKCELRTWVEVLVEDSVAGENVLAQVREMVTGKEFDVVRVVCETGRSAPGLREGASAAAVEDLMGDPAKVFALRLDREPGLDEDERRDLELAFTEVVNRYHEGEEE